MIRNMRERFVRRRQTGITLVELLTVAVIIGILASVALPGYRNYVVRTNRAEVKAALLSTAAGLERCYTQYNTYDNGSCPAVKGMPGPLPSGNYYIRAEKLSATEFELWGEPLNNQKLSDTTCGIFILTSQNQRLTKAGDPDKCWGR